MKNTTIGAYKIIYVMFYLLFSFDTIDYQFINDLPEKDHVRILDSKDERLFVPFFNKTFQIMKNKKSLCGF